MLARAAVQAQRRALLDHGYQPLAVEAAGKAPVEKNWPSTTGLPRWRSDASNTGVLARGLRPLDIDVDDPDAAQAIEELIVARLGAAPVRGRANSGRRLLLYRAAEGAPKKRAVVLSVGKVEALGDGQQFVAHGEHPSGVEYEWRDGALENWPADELRAIAENDLAQVLDELAARFGSPDIPAAPRAPAPEPRPSGNGADSRRAYGKAALESECDRVAMSAEGQRNADLFKSGCRLFELVAGGMLSESDARGALENAARAAGLADLEIRRTIESAYRHGSAQPRGPKERERPFDDEHAPGAEEHAEVPSAPPRPKIVATPFVYVEPSRLPRRDPLYAAHYHRGYVSATLGAGGTGKSTLDIAEAIDMASKRGLFHPVRRALRVWYWNLEDPEDEIDRRIAAALAFHNIGPDDIGDRLFRDSGRTTPLQIAAFRQGGVAIAHDQVAEVLETIEANSIDVLMIDPIISAHAVSENDNVAMTAVVDRLRHIAHVGKVALDFTHHLRKANGLNAEPSADDARGGSAIISACRSARLVSVMTREEAEAAQIELDRRRFYFRLDNVKSNMAPPAIAAAWRCLVDVDLGNGTADRTLRPRPGARQLGACRASSRASAKVSSPSSKGKWASASSPSRRRAATGSGTSSPRCSRSTSARPAAASASRTSWPFGSGTGPSCAPSASTKSRTASNRFTAVAPSSEPRRSLKSRPGRDWANWATYRERHSRPHTPTP